MQGCKVVLLIYDYDCLIKERFVKSKQFSAVSILFTVNIPKLIFPYVHSLPQFTFTWQICFVAVFFLGPVTHLFPKLIQCF
ncbi:hypothetical protein L596_022603 [Steinernema carpocapsae]|uniref:Uncharacterized protein n=1 Tax=Steinernema carpocapsae TaxID=34508 RepID=A0A4U5MM89_STECR|nr:hypothetical protein L596_022603 [Steinernema carpocapsae]